MGNSTTSKKRRRHRHWALVGQGKPGSRGWKKDYDYLSKLTDEEKDFLNKFTEEEYFAGFKHKKHLNRTKEQKRRVYNNNNASNRCIMSLDGIKTTRCHAYDDSYEVLLEEFENTKLVKEEDDSA